MSASATQGGHNQQKEHTVVHHITISNNISCEW